MKYSKIPFLSACVAVLLAVTGAHALSETDVKIVSGTQDVSIDLDGRCRPVGKTVKLDIVRQGFVSFIQVDEPRFRREAVKVGANTVQTLFIQEMQGAYDTTSHILYAYVRFWSCP